MKNRTEMMPLGNRASKKVAAKPLEHCDEDFGLQFVSYQLKCLVEETLNAINGCEIGSLKMNRL
ncbi:hypothetical protein MASR2M44_11210 [Bacteroidota bacterium]